MMKLNVAVWALMAATLTKSLGHADNLRQERCFAVFDPMENDVDQE